MVEQPDGKKTGSAPVNASEYLGLGLTLAASTLFFLWLGTKADAWLGTDPWLSLVGAFVGAGAGFYYLIHHLLIVPKQQQEREDE